MLDERFTSCTSADWAKNFPAYRELVFEIVRPPHEIGDDPQILENNHVVETDYPDLGRTRVAGLPLHINGAPAGRVGPAPTHGQHTEEVLLSLTSCTAEDILILREQGVI
jgi:crotonobetainyl-CoA:carnitine CoA-transferase CaiB-like acyl-CoA transferase